MMLFFALLCISSTAIFIRYAEVPGVVSAFYRMFYAFIFLSPVALYNFKRNLSLGTNINISFVVVLVLSGGVWYALDNAFYNEAINQTEVASAVVLVNLSVIWIGLGAKFFFKEELSIRFWGGAGLALIGIIFVSDISFSNLKFNNYGNLLALISSFFYAAYLLTTQKARAFMDTLNYLWINVFVASLALLLYSLVFDISLFIYPVQSHIYLIMVAFISQVVGFGLITYAQGFIPASHISVILQSQPIFTLVFGVVFLKEIPSQISFLGIILIILGIFLVTTRRKNHEKQSRDQ